jgi:hypothetical protein
VVAFGAVAAVLAIALYFGKIAAHSPAPQVEAASPVRPRIETLPAVEALPNPPLPPSATKSDPGIPSTQGGETPKSQEREPGEEPGGEHGTARKKNRTTSAEKRAILRRQDDAEHSSNPGGTPLGGTPYNNDGSSGGKNKKIRPNPF